MSARTLADFEPLGPAERILVDGLDEGVFDRLGDGSRPSEPDPARRIRAGLLRFVILGGPDAPRVHEKGIRLVGAYVDGVLDLEGCRIPRDIGLVDCRFSAAPVLRSAVIDTLFLDGSAMPGLFAERLEARGEIYLRGAEVGGAVFLPGARLGGGLVGDGAAIGGSPADVALDLTGLTTGGSVLLRGARLAGGLSLVNGRLEGDLDATGARMARPEARALDGDGLEAGGDLALLQAEMHGETVLEGSRIAGDAELSRARFLAPGRVAVSFARARIGGAFILREGASLTGLLTLNGARLGNLADAPESWPAPGCLTLNRCVYEGILAAPVDAESRLRWLALQDPERAGDGFWPQPYEQLARVLAGMGHADDARRVLFEKERLQRRARRARIGGAPVRALVAVYDWLLRVTVGYGLKVQLVFGWLLALWIAGAALLMAGEGRDALRPNNAVVLRSPEWVLCARPAGEPVAMSSVGTVREGLARPGESQRTCWRRQPEAASYPKFNAFMYAIDTMLPALDTGQRTYWSPDTRHPFGRVLKNVTYAITIAGWALSLLAVAAFSGIVRVR